MRVHHPHDWYVRVPENARRGSPHGRERAQRCRCSSAVHCCRSQQQARPASRGPPPPPWPSSPSSSHWGHHCCQQPSLAAHARGPVAVHHPPWDPHPPPAEHQLRARQGIPLCLDSSSDLQRQQRQQEQQVGGSVTPLSRPPAPLPCPSLHPSLRCHTGAHGQRQCRLHEPADVSSARPPSAPSAQTCPCTPPLLSQPPSPHRRLVPHWLPIPPHPHIEPAPHPSHLLTSLLASLPAPVQLPPQPSGPQQRSPTLTSWRTELQHLPPPLPPPPPPSHPPSPSSSSCHLRLFPSPLPLPLSVSPSPSLPLPPLPPHLPSAAPLVPRPRPRPRRARVSP